MSQQLLPWLLLAGAGGLLLGLVLGALVGRRRARRAEARMEVLAEREVGAQARLDELLAERSALAAQGARLEERLAEREERLVWTAESAERQRESFEALASRALRLNADEILQRSREQLAALLESARGDWQVQRKELDQLVQPVAQGLTKLEGEIRGLEEKRQKAYGELDRHLAELLTAQNRLHEATRKLETSLKSPVARGRWGELELARVVEMAGMQEGIHYQQQKGGEQGRPDLLIHLPHGGLLPVDAKAPMNAYFAACEEGDEAARRRHLDAHARALRSHILRLAQKAYFAQFERAPEVVVMFLPNPASMSAAFERDPELLDFALRNRVLPATPVELLALLKAVAYGWQQQRLAESAEQLLAEAQQLFERLAVFLEHHAAVGRELGRAVARYNDSVASYERRLRPALERAGERGIRLEERPQPEVITQAPRSTAAAEGPPSTAGMEPEDDADAADSAPSDERLPPGRSSPG